MNAQFIKDLKTKVAAYVTAANKDDESDAMREAYSDLCNFVGLDPAEAQNDDKLEAIYGKNWETVGVRIEGLTITLK